TGLNEKTELRLGLLQGGDIGQGGLPPDALPLESEGGAAHRLYYDPSAVLYKKSQLRRCCNPLLHARLEMETERVLRHQDNGRAQMLPDEKVPIRAEKRDGSQ